MRNNEAFTGHKQKIGKAVGTSAYSRYDRISRERWLQRNKENTERRKKINPRIVPVTNNPDDFFTDLLLEQQEGGL